MINSYNVSKFCCDDIRLIENYEQAVADNTQTWDCHHRLETDLGLTPKELKEQSKYFNVPASELIFLTHAEHVSLHSNKRWGDPKEHQKQSENLKSEKNPMYGKNAEDYMSEEAIKEKRKKQSENSSWYGTHPKWMNNGIVRVFPKTQEEIEHYRELGYTFGRIYKRKK